MNEYCKDVLRHSWGTGPVRKALEKIYNANYYQENKNRWVVNRQKRKAKRAQQPISPASTNAPTVADIVNPLVPNIFESNERMEQVMNQQIKTSSSAIKNVINSGRKATKAILNTIGDMFTTAFDPKNNKEIAAIVSDTKELFKNAFKFKF